MLVGNKCDLTSKKVVNTDDAERYAATLGECVERWEGCVGTCTDADARQARRGRLSLRARISASALSFLLEALTYGAQAFLSLRSQQGTRPT